MGILRLKGDVGRSWGVGRGLVSQQPGLCLIMADHLTGIDRGKTLLQLGHQVQAILHIGKTRILGKGADQGFKRFFGGLHGVEDSRGG